MKKNIVAAVYSKVLFYWNVLGKSITGFIKNDMVTHAAAISYYTVFSLPSMLLIVLWIVARLYKEGSVHEIMAQKITSLAGEQISQQVMSTIGTLSIQETTGLGAFIGIGLLLFFATTVFDAMRTALNQIAQIKASSSVGLNVWRALRVRFIALNLLVSLSFLLLISLVLNVMLSTFTHQVVDWAGKGAEWFTIMDSFLVDLITTTLLFTLYLRYLPDTRLKWRDSFFGAIFTAGLFIAGKSIISSFISSNQVVDLYDAAGSLLALMLWVYYASIIFLFGATFTFTLAKENRKKNSIVSSPPKD